MILGGPDLQLHCSISALSPYAFSLDVSPHMAIILYGRQAYWTRAPPYLTEVTLLAVTLFDPSEVTFCSAEGEDLNIAFWGKQNSTHNKMTLRCLEDLLNFNLFTFLHTSFPCPYKVHHFKM